MTIVNLLGNGDSAHLYNKHKRIAGDKTVICNMPPFEVRNVFACVMVDFKMMRALAEGSLKLDAYEWVLGNRPRKWMEMQPAFYLKYSRCIKEFYTVVPSYAENATNFNCGHMAAHYSCNKLGATQIHMFGFDSIFDFNLRSVTDLYLNSDRSNTNNYRLIDIWRPIWIELFKEFPDVKFLLHHTHDNIKINLPENVSIVK